MSPIDYSDLLSKLPHRGPMRLIDSVVKIDEKSVESLTHINHERFDYFGSNSKIESYWGVELIAQSGALPLVLNSASGVEYGGVIVQVKSFRSYSHDLRAPVTLTICCETERLMNGSVAWIRGSVYDGEVPVCEADITLAMQKE